MNARKLLDLTRGAHALQAALGAALDTAIDERNAAREAAQYVERCLREAERTVLIDASPIASSENMWPSTLVMRLGVYVDGLRVRIAALEADLAATVRRTEQ